MSSSSSDSSSSEAESSSSAVQRAHKRKRPSSDDSSDSDPAAEPSDEDSSSSSAEEEEAAADDDDAPVLSHAELRRQKKKQHKTTASPTDDAKKTQKGVKNTAELAPSKVPKRQNSVWVGNMAFKTTPDALRRFFDGVGEITRVHMPMKMASGGPGARGAVKENRGFAYVDFATPEAKTIAITLSENPLDGRKLLIKDGDDFAGRPAAPAPEDADAKPGLTGHTKTAQKILRSQKQPAGPTLFLGNLGFETTEDAIRALFMQHRELKVVAEDEEKKPDKWIRKIRMGTFEDTGKCKGWAFVDFTTTEHATTALTNPKNHFLGGRKLVVEYASPEAVRRGGAGSRPKKPDADGAEKPRRERRRQPREERTRARAKPGAALASAKRETVGIVPSLGKKIVF
ncbi:hypothetical protein PHLGIDRAFT_503084 [Phlebiopsis gigantea 11061_1 CR5-6]|uniref:RRM domain-containing protein n=1 Tax=Phlebiopsis gigantea (strain 11061_1 CR5-6) TaxID=745531 RepID=A0A0C3RQJ3_PHLG1|nr:hypothetical protein PHLGIDRAFT_503084 [Phlebiopsis gigantea 11061_1 CR5-6]